MGYVLEGLAYVGGTALVGAGLYLVMRGSFPAWWPLRFVWPVMNVTPLVARLQGWVTIVLGASILALVFTTVAPETVAGALVLGAVLAYVVAVGLFVFSTWVSRRPAP